METHLVRLLEHCHLRCEGSDLDSCKVRPLSLFFFTLFLCAAPFSLVTGGVVGKTGGKKDEKVVRREGQGGGAVGHSRAGRGSTKNNTGKRTHSHGTVSMVAMTTTTLYTCTQQCTMYVCTHTCTVCKYLFCPFTLPLLVHVPPLHLLKAL